MKLKDIPAPVWYLAGAAVVGVVAYRMLKSGAAAVGAAINPVNPNNAAATGVNAVGAAVTGNDNWNLGGAVFDLFNPSANNAVSAPVQVTRTPYANPKTGTTSTTNKANP